MRNLILVLAILALGCHEQNKNKISPAELVKSREIKKVSEADLLKGAGLMAEEIIGKLDSLVDQRMNKDSIDCNTESWPAVDTLSKEYKAKIRLIRLASTNLSELEYQLLEAYQYNLENSLALTTSVQKLDERSVLYTSPLSAGDWGHCQDSKGPRIWSLKISIKEIISRL